MLGAGEPPDRQDTILSAPVVPMGKDRAPMVLIPEGEFIMGSNGGSENERPEHKVWLPTYAIDQFEVTIERYARFLQETGRRPPLAWNEGVVNTAGDRPVVGVSWEDADTYCTWAGKRMPTEAEWEKAARGTDGRQYPWGAMPPVAEIANYSRGVWISEAVTLAPVTSGHGLKQAGQSPYGLHHMAGNAAEWVADWYDPDYYSKSPLANPKGPLKGTRKVIRGGSWLDPPQGIRTTARIAAPPDFRDRTVSFRCARDVLKPSS